MPLMTFFYAKIYKLMHHIQQTLKSSSLGVCVLIMPSVTMRDTHCYQNAKNFQSSLSHHLFEYFISESVIEISWCFSVWNKAVLHLTAYLQLSSTASAERQILLFFFFPKQIQMSCQQHRLKTFLNCRGNDFRNSSILPCLHLPPQLVLRCSLRG